MTFALFRSWTSAVCGECRALLGGGCNVSTPAVVACDKQVFVRIEAVAWARAKESGVTLPHRPITHHDPGNDELEPRHSRGQRLESWIPMQDQGYENEDKRAWVK